MMKITTSGKRVLSAFLAVFALFYVLGSMLYVVSALSLNKGAYYCKNAADLAREPACPLDLFKVAVLIGDALFANLILSPKLWGIPLAGMVLVIFAFDYAFDGVGGGRVLWSPRGRPAPSDGAGRRDAV